MPVTTTIIFVTCHMVTAETESKAFTTGLPGVIEESLSFSPFLSWT